MNINVKDTKRYSEYLINEEKSYATKVKYSRIVRHFFDWLNGRSVDKMTVLEYKEYLTGIYQPSSVNAALSALNGFFSFMRWEDLKVRTLKIQKQIFSRADKELSKEEYERLLTAANNQPRLKLIMQTICSTGIRVSELKYITAEAVQSGTANINCKGKLRTVILTSRLCKLLRRYMKNRKIKSGSIFITRSGKPVDRSNIWSAMKKLCKLANVAESKVFPHNLRHLFARTYYSIQKDIVRLADILGHSSINTTRIYTMESGAIHRRQLQDLGLLQC